jgi:hypothetical protein
MRSAGIQVILQTVLALGVEHVDHLREFSRGAIHALGRQEVVTYQVAAVVLDELVGGDQVRVQVARDDVGEKPGLRKKSFLLFTVLA